MRRMRDLSGSYFRWLCSLLEGERRSYLKLYTILHAKPFNWFVPNDDNRAEDGKALRLIFIDAFNINPSTREIDAFLAVDCTVFEMMIALAKRMDDIVTDPRKGEFKLGFFQEMIRNLGLDEFRDSFFAGLVTDRSERAAYRAIEEILTVLLNREYDRNGRGSLFPAKGYSPKDLRKVEIWYQMQQYIEEHYQI